MDSIRANMVVSMEYALTLDSGEVVDSSEGREPLTFIAGLGQIISGLEQALAGMTAGQEKDVTVAPEDAYGEHNPDLVEELPRSIFPPEVEVGESYNMQTEQGASVVVYVEEVNDEVVIVNLNHPLAGETLHFHVKIVDVHEASEEELAEAASCCSCGCEDCGEDDEACDCGHDHSKSCGCR